MPAISTKQFAVVTMAGSNTSQTSTEATPATPSRQLLYIQNVGGNPGLLHIKENVQGDGSDLVIPAGGDFGPFDQADTCPRERINLGSAAATTWVVLEQVER